MSATNTSKTFLMNGTTANNTTTYAKLVDIKDYPDLQGTREQLEITTLSDLSQKFIDGIKSGDTKEFLANYDKTDFETLEALEGVEQNLAVWFGGTVSDGVVTPTGTDGKFEFKGYVSVKVNAGSVNAVREMTISINVSSDVELGN